MNGARIGRRVDGVPKFETGNHRNTSQISDCKEKPEEIEGAITFVTRNLHSLSEFDQFSRRKFVFSNHRKQQHKAVGAREPVKTQSLYDATVLSEFVLRIVLTSVWLSPSWAGVAMVH